MISDINDRIRHLIIVSAMNPTSFAATVDVNVTVIFNIIKGRRSKPSYDLIHKILEAHDQVNADWLLKGEGSMWNDKVVQTSDIAPPHAELESRISMLIQELRAHEPESYVLEELEELVALVIKANGEQKEELMKINQNKEKTLKKVSGLLGGI